MGRRILILLLLSGPALAFADSDSPAPHKTAHPKPQATPHPAKKATVHRQVEYLDGESAPESPQGAKRRAIRSSAQQRVDNASHPPIREGWKVPVDGEQSWDQREQHRQPRPQAAPRDDFDDPHGGSVHMDTDLNGDQMSTHF